MKSKSELSGELITSAIRRAGLTQSELARVMGRHRNEVYKWANGIQRPNVASLIELWEALKAFVPGLRLEELAVPGDKRAQQAARLTVAEADEAAEEVQDGEVA